ncbi:hypothetical protein H7F51_01235 [Novosphingobium flavum]|uniref:DUF1269 domain-containing protein n=1 Tax=Novosphingobium flavum TaxID=1778672 RepID=A0A7X1FNP9_9SPHN|nr:hypothetical protein [Novosphingobium flavum]MBC2664134.1 hypothetical protein [Novosphingobium flavum]
MHALKGEEDIPDFVIKAADLPVLNYMSSGYPRPQTLEWIDRGTDRKLRRSTIDMLARTLFTPGISPSVAKLHERAGLRISFETEAERLRFSHEFRAGQAVRADASGRVVTAVFRDRAGAEHAVIDLKAAGVPEGAISLLWRTGQFLEPEPVLPRGHSLLSVAGATTGGGIAGALLGMTMLMIPGIGGVAAAGALAATAISSIAAFGSALGATGGAIARMLTDMDVDGREAEYFEEQVVHGRVFVAIELGKTTVPRGFIQDVLLKSRGVMHF